MEISDITARVAKLESAQTPAPPETVQAGEDWVFFPSKIQLVYTSPSASTSWADSGSAKYIPSTAKRAICMAAVEDTTSGVGQTLMEASGGGVVRPIAWIYEFNAGDVMSSASGDVHIPLSGGRFDWRVTLAGGASGANVRIYLLGYVN